MALKDTDLVEVYNRNNGFTGYTLPENNVRRVFSPGEKKKISLGELRALQYTNGGAAMINDVLIIDNKEALEALNMNVEPEYFYKEADIERMLMTASLDEFADFLDFAPEGAIDIAKDMAVEKELPNNDKRKMLSEKTGFNIDNAIRVKTIMNEDTIEKPVEEKQRRVKKEEEQPKVEGRRAPAPQYKVVSK